MTPTSLVFGGGTHSGRGMRLASEIMWKASNDIIAKGKRVAALLLQAKPEAITFSGGRFAVDGTGQSIGLFEIAEATLRARRPAGGAARAARRRVRRGAAATRPFRSAPMSARSRSIPSPARSSSCKYSAVDDVGRAVNPMIIHGQTHGGIAQGVGQALLEHCFYDSRTGQLLSGSFMDYAMPRAACFPFFNTGISEVPMPTHPLGIRPAGEGGTTPALAVVVNAIVDALS